MKGKTCETFAGLMAAATRMCCFVPSCAGKNQCRPTAACDGSMLKIPPRLLELADWRRPAAIRRNTQENSAAQCHGEEILDGQNTLFLKGQSAPRNE